MIAFVLSSFKADEAIKKCDSKEDTIQYCGTQDFEIILILLIKVVEIYVRFFQICFWGFSLK